jgi:hypothetical protein
MKFDGRSCYVVREAISHKWGRRLFQCTKSTLSMYLPTPFIVCGIHEIIGLQNWRLNAHYSPTLRACNFGDTPTKKH